MDKFPRIPYGLAKWIIQHMRRGECIYVRDRYIISFRKAARELGARVISNTVERRGQRLWRIRRLWSKRGSQPTGHRYQRMPLRMPATGRFIKDAAAGRNT